MLLKLKSEQILVLFLIVLTSINLLQSYSTELLMDESYYWYFSKNLHWGYFDHPPFVALLVKAGYFLFKNELGVRLLAPILFSTTIFLIWKAIDHPKKRDHVLLYILFISSVTLINAYGFFMLPDTPLIFFASLLLLGYKRYLEKSGPLSVILLVISFTGIMYSKYHGFLFIVFLILSNLALLKQKKFWIIILISLFMYLPHLFWLYHTDFASLKYHLVERADSDYKINFTLEYLLGLAAVVGFSFPITYYAILKDHRKDLFTKALKFIFWGIVIFFFISSFNRRTQAQWPVLALLPLIIITYNYVLENHALKKWLIITSTTSFIALLYFRAALVHKELSPIVYETHGNKEWIKELNQQAGDLPVVFQNSYRDASMYEFYSGVRTYSLNGLEFRQNQYDLDGSETSMQHKKVTYLSYDPLEHSTLEVTRKFKNVHWHGKVIDDFTSWRKLKCTVNSESIKLSDTISITLKNPYIEAIPLQKLRFNGVTLDSKKRILDTLTVTITSIDLPPKISPEQSISIKIKLDSKKTEKAPYFRFTISENDLPFGFQGEVLKIKH